MVMVVMVVMAGVVRAGKRPFHGGGQVLAPAKAVKQFQTGLQKPGSPQSEQGSQLLLVESHDGPAVDQNDGCAIEPQPDQFIDRGSVATHVALDVRH